MLTLRTIYIYSVHQCLDKDKINVIHEYPPSVGIFPDDCLLVSNLGLDCKSDRTFFNPANLIDKTVYNNY